MISAALVYDDPRFLEYFSAATPEAGARCAAHRQPAGTAQVVGRPADPSRHSLAVRLDADTAAARVLARRRRDARRGVPASDRDVCRQMYREWPFFRSTLDLMEMALAKADAAIAAHYDRYLVPKRTSRRSAASCASGCQRAIDGRARDHRARVLLEENPVLRRSIDVRNPYVDPINVLQVELLRRLRAVSLPDGGQEENDEVVLLRRRCCHHQRRLQDRRGGMRRFRDH